MKNTQHERDLSQVPDQFQQLLTRKKEKAARELYTYVSTLASTDLITLDVLFRERTSMDWSRDWSRKDPLTLLPRSVSEDMKKTILGLATFHPDGYFRERALRVHEELDSILSLPFLLLRCMDWVKEVREVANHLVRSKIRPEHATSFVDHLPILFKWRESERADKGLLEVIFSMLTEEGAALIKGTSSNHPRIRHFSYRSILQGGRATQCQLIEWMKRESEPHSRLLLYRSFTETVTEDAFMAAYPVLKHDRFPQIRADVLRRYHSMHPEDENEVRKALFDRSGMIRSVARYLMKENGVADVVAIYREAIQEGTSLRGAILGLGETGDAGDAERILPFLERSEPGIVKASIRSLGFIGGGCYQEELIDLLNHEHRGVAKEARRALQHTGYDAFEDRIYGVYAGASTLHTALQCAVLLGTLPKWKGIRYSIEMSPSTEPAIRELGRHQVDRWLRTFNKTFTVPTSDQKHRIKEALQKHGDALPPDVQRELAFCLK
ncbi:HEAT repeat domain-containing protein [Rossellomorea marisflavi]|uniref:HEAT repeat domain-containing protein n=1 Tax=Rossellomorea marisflavi TaxID=189381 RepID=UPI0035166999